MKAMGILVDWCYKNKVMESDALPFAYQAAIEYGFMMFVSTCKSVTRLQSSNIMLHLLQVAWNVMDDDMILVLLPCVGKIYEESIRIGLFQKCFPGKRGTLIQQLLTQPHMKGQMNEDPTRGSCERKKPNASMFDDGSQAAIDGDENDTVHSLSEKTLLEEQVVPLDNISETSWKLLE